MPVEIPSVQCHIYSPCSDLDRRPGIDTKAFATAVPIEDDPPVGYFYPAVPQVPVASLVKAETVGGNLNKVLVGAPGAEINELIIIQWFLAGRCAK